MMQVPARPVGVEEERGRILGSSYCWSSLHWEGTGAAGTGVPLPGETRHHRSLI